MPTLQRYTGPFNGFEWMNFDDLPNSQGYKMEIYIRDSEVSVDAMILSFHHLFRATEHQILIHPFNPEGIWGNFCLDTWNIDTEDYDYSTTSKKDPTLSYLRMLEESHIEPEYAGFCTCLNWDKFLYITMHCIMEHMAVYGTMFYIENTQIAFYFHHTGSIGVYYRELNKAVKQIICTAMEHDMHICHYNDDRLSGIIGQSGLHGER